MSIHSASNQALSRAAIMTARLHRLKEEHEREPGWLQGLA